MPLPLIAWAVIEIAVGVAARVAVREVAKAVVKEAVKTGVKQVAKEGTKQAVKEGTKQVTKKATEAAAKIAKHKGKPTKGNTTTKRHKAKEKKKDEKKLTRCTLRPYKPDTCKPKTGHHVVPDRVFRIGSRDSGQRIPGGPSESEGLVICVEGQNLSKGEEHGKIHGRYDKAEAALGKMGKPPGTTKLLKLEMLGAASVAKITGCDAKKMMKELRKYHKSKGLGPSALVRADPYGKISQSLDASKMGSGLTNIGAQTR
jgi:hypothetical protein